MKTVYYSLILCFGMLTLFAVSGFGAVSGSYQFKGNHVLIHVMTDPPAPRAFIVMQSLPPGVKIVSAHPRPQNFMPNGAKWLFSNMEPGKIVIDMQLSRPVPPKLLKGEIRFRKPGNNAMISSPIR